MSADLYPVAAELTIYQVADLQRAWLAAYRGGARRFGLADVSEVDSAGLQLLAALKRMAERDGDPVVLCDAPAALRDALDLLGAAALLDDGQRDA